MEAYLKLLVEGQDLTFEQAADAMDLILNGNATDAQIACFLTAMRIKGEITEEIAACAATMRAHAVRLYSEEDVLDIVGTGGDCSNSFNVSTCAAFVIAAAGVKVAKHGNRSVSSKCGAADALAALGVKIDLAPEQNQQVLNAGGICFMFAPLYHTAMKYVMPARKQMGIRTLFNILGPLSNPASAQLMVLGVYEEALVEPMARVLLRLGVKRAYVVYGQDGLDEISLSAPTSMARIDGGAITLSTLHPAELGFALCKKEDLIGGDATVNAGIIERILGGERGPKRDIVVLNAAVAISAAKPELSLADAVALAQCMLDSGAAKEKYETLKRLTTANQ